MSKQNTPASAPGEDVVRPHSYDGIEEYDNPLPGWWKWSFYVTIVWSGVYVIAIGLGLVNDYGSDLAAESSQVDTMVRIWEETHPKPNLTDEMLAAGVAESGTAEHGAVVFAARCASCHGPQGQGLIGPNLTDSYWIHGGRQRDIYNVISTGVAEKGMPAWGPILKPTEMIAVVSWVQSVQGSNPEGAKAPQGELYQAP